MYTHPQRRSVKLTQKLRNQAGRWLRQLREERGISQRELAKKVGAKYYTFISQLELGRGRIPPGPLHRVGEGLGSRAATVCPRAHVSLRPGDLQRYFWTRITAQGLPQKPAQSRLGRTPLRTSSFEHKRHDEHGFSCFVFDFNRQSSPGRTGQHVPRHLCQSERGCVASIFDPPEGLPLLVDFERLAVSEVEVKNWHSRRLGARP